MTKWTIRLIVANVAAFVLTQAVPRLMVVMMLVPAHILELESELARQLGTRVAIETRKNGQRGKIIIDFYSLDEFDRITERIGFASMEQV